MAVLLTSVTIHFTCFWNKLPGVAASATEWAAFTDPLASGDNTVIDAPKSNKCCCNTFGRGQCKERVGNTWDAAVDFVDKLGFTKFDEMLDDASLPYPTLLRLRGAAPDAVPLLILRATALLNPSVPIMCTFEPYDVAPGQIARPLQGASGSFGFLSPTSLARALHTLGNPIVIERLTYTWIGLTQCLIRAVEDVTQAILLSRARAPRDEIFEAARSFRNVAQPRKRMAARERAGRRRVRRKSKDDDPVDGEDEDDTSGETEDGHDPGENCAHSFSKTFFVAHVSFVSP